MGNSHWYKTKAQLWSRNLNPGDGGPGLKCQGMLSLYSIVYLYSELFYALSVVIIKRLS